jgi:hypothetical protein
MRIRAVAFALLVLAAATFFAWGPERPGPGRGIEVIPVRIEIHADGRLRVDRLGGWQELGIVSLEDPRTSAVVLEGLRSELESRARRPALRDPSRLRWNGPFEITSAGDAPWYMAQWVFQICSSVDVDVTRIRLCRIGESSPVEWDVPQTGSWFPRIDAPYRFVLVEVEGPRTSAAGSDEVLRVAVGSQAEEVPENDQATVVEQSARCEDVGALRAWLLARAALVRDRHGRVETPLPRGVHTPCGLVLDAWRALVDSGVADVQLTGPALPLPRER